MLTEGKIRFKNVLKPTQFTLDNTTDQKSTQRCFLVCGVVIPDVGGDRHPTCRNLL
jgi:hypothetical protein